MSQTPWTNYDEVPYESHPFPQSHPDRLATIATLLGMRPRPITQCRVLELGGASGGNLIPLALTLPGSTFLGIDQSSRQIADGLKVISELGLKNVELKQMSILDVSPDLGRFDYLICHGVFSWVPSAVQDKILDICGQNLAPQGVAYVSYNTYPGWHMRGMIRDMMRFHAEHFTDARMRVKQARNLLDFLAKSAVKENTPYSLLLQSELESVRQSKDYYLYHEQLEECNDPLYFHQFARRAEAKGLRYLAEVDLRVMVPSNFPPEIASVLHMLSPDLLHLEQYMDFLRNRMFRQTLLCHQQVTPNYALRPEQLSAFFIASPAKPVSSQPDLSSTKAEEFRAPDGVTLSASEPLVKAALLHLSEVWPQAVSFEALRQTARARLQPEARTDTAQETQRLGQCFLTAYTSAANLVELRTQALPLVTQVRDRPMASPLARLQAAAGHQVTNLRHERVVLDDFGRQVLRPLDGQHNRSALLEVLTNLAVQGELTVQREGQPVTETVALRQVLSEALDPQLALLARQGSLSA